MTVKEFVRLRTRLFKTRRAAAEALGVGRTTVDNWENGTTKIPVAVQKLIRCWLGLPQEKQRKKKP